MKKQIHIGTILLFCLTIIFIGITVNYDNDLFYSLAITFGTFFYHFFMRLLVGRIVNGVKHNQFDYSGAWFQEKSFEADFYKKLKIKSWKIGIPTYDPDTFDIKKHSLEEIVMATCQAEVVHEIIVVLSFVPILFSLEFGAVSVFILTSVAAGCFDMIFVLLQRFNRPRLVKMLKREKR